MAGLVMTHYIDEMLSAEEYLQGINIDPVAGIVKLRAFPGRRRPAGVRGDRPIANVSGRLPQFPGRSPEISGIA